MISSGFVIIFFHMPYFQLILILISACRESGIYEMPTQQTPYATPQERKAGKHDRGQTFEAGATHDKVVL